MLRILTHLVLQELCAVGPVILLILQLREGGGAQRGCEICPVKWQSRVEGSRAWSLGQLHVTLPLSMYIFWLRIYQGPGTQILILENAPRAQPPELQAM